MKIPDFSWLIYLLKKNKEIFKAIFQGLFHIHRLSPLRFQGPVGAMYQSVGKCFRMHLRATSIHKIPGGLGGPLTPRQFYGAQLAPQPIR